MKLPKGYEITPAVLNQIPGFYTWLPLNHSLRAFKQQFGPLHPTRKSAELAILVHSKNKVNEAKKKICSSY